MYCLFLAVVPVHRSKVHKIGLLLNSEELEDMEAIKRVALHTIEKSHSVELVIRYHDHAYLNVMRAICELMNNNVIAVLSASGSTITEVQGNILGQFKIPLIAGVATNPYFPAISKKYLLSLSPSDIYQSTALFGLLKQYGWRDFAIIASANDYGINGIVHLQYLAAQDRNFNVRNVQHFDVEKKVSAGINQKLFNKELSLIRDSLSKVIVLNCNPKFAKQIFR